MATLWSRGDQLDFAFSVVVLDSTTISIVVESRGGTRGTPTARNIDYAPGLDELFRRLQVLEAIVQDVRLAPLTATRSVETEITVPEHPLPWRLSAVDDVMDLRLALGRAQARTNREPNAAGRGNPTKRIRLVCSFPAQFRAAPDIESVLANMEPSQYWAFLGNPSMYDVQTAVRDLEYDFWKVDDSDVRAGDWAIIWKAKGREAQRGIIAFAEVLSDPEIIQVDGPFWVTENLNAPFRRVKIRYVKTGGLPLWEDQDRTGLLESLSVSRATGGTVFRVSRKQWIQLCQLVGNPAAMPETALVREVGPQPNRKFRFASSIELKEAVEKRAMDVAANFFRSEGWDVDPSVAATCCYDLLCRRDGNEMHVEVKGTTGDGTTVILTKNEVWHAKAFRHCVLAIVSGISYDHTSKIAEGGSLWVADPWHIEESALEALSYSYCRGFGGTEGLPARTGAQSTGE